MILYFTVIFTHFFISRKLLLEISSFNTDHGSLDISARRERILIHQRGFINDTNNPLGRRSITHKLFISHLTLCDIVSFFPKNQRNVSSRAMCLHRFLHRGVTVFSSPRIQLLTLLLREGGVHSGGFLQNRLSRTCSPTVRRFFRP